MNVEGLNEYMLTGSKESATDMVKSDSLSAEMIENDMIKVFFSNFRKLNFIIMKEMITKLSIV